VEDKRELQCNFCKYEWFTKSKMLRPTCPSCRKAVWNGTIEIPQKTAYVDGVPQFTHKNEVIIR